MVISSLASASAIRARSALAVKPPNTTVCMIPSRAQASIAIDGFGDQRHVDGDAVTGDQTEVGQRVGRLAYLGLQVGVGQAAAVVDGFALPVDGDPIPVAGLDVAVHAVVGDVELAADEPFGERRLRPVQHLGKGVAHDSRSACLAQNASRSSLGLLVQSSRALACSANCVGGGYDGLAFGCGVGHWLRLLSRGSAVWWAIGSSRLRA